MTPQLMQAIKLLQLSNLELTTYVDGEVERNPLLERGTEVENEADRSPTDGNAASAEAADWPERPVDAGDASPAEAPNSGHEGNGYDDDVPARYQRDIGVAAWLFGMGIGGSCPSR